MIIVTNSVCNSGNLVCKPSMAEEMVMGGVIIPSANNAHPPTTAGIISHLARRRTSENNEKIPPSPLLSARSVITTYFKVVWSVSVQTINDIPPSTRLSDIF